uniref:vomeronasal type-1 receptor 90-like n=1 Tax=Jaculus jaculus TaxID=51337 RepID=UPI001E1B3878|nr:vomeronasal type-1 receptor 90-like [Jaculus jaculus]
MNKHVTIIGITNAFLSEVAIGISANTAVLLLQALTLHQHRLQAVSLVTVLLAVTHTAMLLTTAFIATDILGSRGFWQDVTCKSVLSLYRLARSLSICATCYLSVLQAITLSPRSSCLAKFKCKSLPHNLCGFLVLWVFYMSLSGHFLSLIAATPNVTSEMRVFVTKSCALWPLDYFLRHFLFVLVVFRDTVLMALMSLSSGYMVILLCGHQRRAGHLHSARLSAKASAEQRAAQTVLLLMSTFVVMYFLDCAASLSRVMWNNDPVYRCVQLLMSNGYATVSPLVFISAEQHTINFLKFTCGRTVNACLLCDGQCS